MSTSGDPKFPTPTIVTAVHPGNKAQFRDVAVSKSELRQAKTTIQRACSYCTKPNTNVTLLMCARCKIAMYCSRQCQKTDWPQHKRSCTETTSTTPRLVTSLVSNEVLHLHLQIALVLLFNIATPPPLGNRKRSFTDDGDITSRLQNISLEDVTPNAGNWDEVPFIAKCKVGVQPCDMNNVVKILSGKLTDAERASIEGMLQLSELVPSELSAPPIPPVSSSASAPAPLPAPPFQGKTRLEPWKEAKAAAERMRADHPSSPKLPVCLLDFALPDAKQFITVSIIIQPGAILWVKEGLGFSFESAVLPIKKEIPLSVESCLEFINTHIRDDKKNQIRLRTTMTKELIEYFVSPQGQGRGVE